MQFKEDGRAKQIKLIVSAWRYGGCVRGWRNDHS